MNLCTEKFKSLKPPLELAWGGLDGRVKKKKNEESLKKEWKTYTLRNFFNRCQKFLLL